MPSVFEGDSLDLALQAFYRQTRRQRAAEQRQQRRLAAAAAPEAEGGGPPPSSASSGVASRSTHDATADNSSSEEGKSCKPSVSTSGVGVAERKGASGERSGEEAKGDHAGGVSAAVDVRTEEGEHSGKREEPGELNKSSLLDAIVKGDNNGLAKLHVVSGKVGAKEEDEAAACQSAEVECLQKILSPFILRRLKNEVLGDLPKKINVVLRCEMPERQKEMYVNEIQTWQSELTRSLEKLTSELTGSPPPAPSAASDKRGSLAGLSGGSAEPSSSGAAQQGAESATGASQNTSGGEAESGKAQSNTSTGGVQEKAVSSGPEDFSAVAQENESDGPSTAVSSTDGSPVGQAVGDRSKVGGKEEGSQAHEMKSADGESPESRTSAEVDLSKGGKIKGPSEEGKEHRKQDDVGMACSLSASRETAKPPGGGSACSSVSAGSEQSSSSLDPSAEGERTTDDVCMEGGGGGTGTAFAQPTTSAATLASRKKFVNSLLFRLRRICNHPLLMQGAYTNEQLQVGTTPGCLVHFASLCTVALL